MTPEEIMRQKALGASKRAERAAKKAVAQQKVEEKSHFDYGFQNQVKEAGFFLEKVYYHRAELTSEREKEIENLFLPEADKSLKAATYQLYMGEYEILIFYSWEVSKSLQKAAFSFWDEVLEDDKSSFSGNSIIRILGGRPNENLLKILQNHQAKFFAEPHFKRILLTIVERSLQEKGPFDFHTRTFGTWTEKEKEIWQEILTLF